jgi:hypothetical protein
MGTGETTFDYEYTPEHLGNASALAVVPLVLDLLGGHVAVRSVVDVGCGLAAWLKVFEDQGIEDIVGLDGDHVDRGLLAIDAERFVPCDLRSPPSLHRRFDLAVSLEVAEHLPAEAADVFVNLLASLADVVLFSAAVPRQGGLDHLNEQWPAYWAAKFQARGFRCHDTLRQRIWEDERVRWWYRQNLLLFLREGTAPGLAGSDPAPLVHPGLLDRTHERYQGQLRAKGGVRGVARELTYMAGKALGRRGAPRASNSTP